MLGLLCINYTTIKMVNSKACTWYGMAGGRPQRGLREHGSQGPDAIRTLFLLISVYRSASLCVPVEVQGLKP